MMSWVHSSIRQLCFMPRASEIPRISTSCASSYCFMEPFITAAETIINKQEKGRKKKSSTWLEFVNFRGSILLLIFIPKLLILAIKSLLYFLSTIREFGSLKECHLIFKVDTYVFSVLLFSFFNSVTSICFLDVNAFRCFFFILF